MLSNCINFHLQFFCRRNMVEAMHEQHPDFFKQHRKNFRYLVLEKEPRVGLDIPSGSNYAFGVHSFTSDYLCGFEKQPHYHVLFECDSSNRKGYNVPCLYTTFCLLLADCSSLVMQGEIMNRLQVAMKYNVKENKTLLAQGRRKVPVVQIRRDKSVQTGFLPTATFSRFQQLIQGPSAATLYRILDILNDGYGSIDTTNLYFSIDNSKTL